MSDAELAVAIAEAEGWTEIVGSSDFWAGFIPGDTTRSNRWDTPRYLTDPRETVRMTKELLQGGYWSSYLHDDASEIRYLWHKVSKPPISGKSYERATAIAYLRMINEN